MTILTKTWAFASDLDGWTAAAVSNGGLGWVSTDGGSVQGWVAGRNKGTTNNISLTLSTTYGALGIPSQATVSNIQLYVDHKCVVYHTIDVLSWWGQIDGVTRIDAVNYSATSAFATASSSLLSVTKTDTDSIALSILGSIDLANNASAEGRIAWDNIVLEITYDAYVPQTTINTWNGSQWVPGKLWRYNGSTWIKEVVKRWNGTEWVTIG
jgi:hypothetical protein